MADREKVIRGLEWHAGGICNALTSNGKEYCPYWDDNDNCMVHLLNDTITLLKPAKAVRIHNTKVKDIGEKVFVANCNNCSGYLIEGWKACPTCGKAVTWDG